MLNLQDLEALEDFKQFHHFPDTTVTVCCVTLLNGFSVVGYSACVDPAEFDEVIGQRQSYYDAIRRLWELEAYRVVGEGKRATP